MDTQLRRPERISAGSHDLNVWLHGGYERDVISMIAGPAGSGKTNFCMLVAASQAKKGKKVIFVDTEGGFSIDRFEQLLEKNNESLDLLDQVLLLKPTSFTEQRKVFRILAEELSSGQVGVIIVDSMTMLYRLELGGAASDKTVEKEERDERVQSVNRAMAGMMKFLAEITRKHTIPVIITNQVYQEFLTAQQRSDGVRPTSHLVGGDLLKYWSKCIIELQHDDGKRRAYLMKHRSLPPSSFYFTIVDHGILKRGWR